MKSLLFFAFNALCCIFIVQCSTINDDHYYAAVVEYSPARSDDVTERTRSFMNFIKSADAELADIIVFPQLALNYLDTSGMRLPDPFSDTAPCDRINEFHLSLFNISCAARDTKKYVLVNVDEEIGGDKCSTNVVFDRNGRLISRYRITDYLTSQFIPEIATFTTDFGVRFGHFARQDLLFYQPAEQLVREYKVTDLILSTDFESSLPFLTGVQLQQSWAWANNVNLLAAGSSAPSLGTTGSGIYAGNAGTLDSVVADNQDLREILVAKVSKIQNVNSKLLQNVRNQRIKTTNSATTFASAAVSTATKSNSNRNSNSKAQRALKLPSDPLLQNATYSDVYNYVGSESYYSCINRQCCNITVSKDLKFIPQIPNSVSYSYRLVHSVGTQQLENQKRNNTVFVCALLACTNSTMDSCGDIFGVGQIIESLIQFSSIYVSYNFTQTDDMLVMPNTLNYGLYPIEPKNAEFYTENHENGNSTRFVLNATSSLISIKTFGIYAIQYGERNSTGKGDGAAAMHAMGIFTIIFTVVLGKVITC